MSNTNFLKLLCSRKKPQDYELKEAIKRSLQDITDDPINVALKESVNNQKDNNITDLDEFNSLVQAAIISFGGEKILPNSGNGDCLFHSLSEHLNIDQSQLREDAVNYISTKWDRFSNFALNPDTLEPFNSKDDYIQYMGKEGHWGDHLSILALCELYQVNATLIVTEGNKLSEPININVGADKTILIKFTSEFHYEAIV